jgi:H+-translocating NAD(P) transhydrogenase subunit alpha
MTMVEHLDVSLFVFMLATFLGLEVIRRVSPLLHTPLMSLTNAISAITVVGAILVAGAQKTPLATVLGTVAVAASTINIVGGYLITYRMLRMFKTREKGKR